MKILMLTPYLPYPLITGGQTRSFNLIKRLSELNHEITLFCLVKTEQERSNISQLEKYCKEVQVFKRAEKPWTLNNILTTGLSFYPFLVIRNWAKGESSAISKKLKEEKFDLIHAETFYVMPHIPKTFVPIVLVDQTIEFQVYQHYVDNVRVKLLKPLLYLDVAKMKYWELRYWKQAKKVIAMSKDDLGIMKSQIPSIDVAIVPNGVDSNYFGEKVSEKSKDPIILYLGNFTWLQNREAVDILLRKIWPKIKSRIKNAKLWIIGKDAPNFFPKLSNPDIRVEEVKDVRSIYQAASILVAPIYGAGGTRYKNFEAFASGLPVITTSIGISGTDAENGKEVIIRDKPADIADAAIKLLKNPKLQKTLAANAKRMVNEKYDWSSITQKLSDVYVEVSNG